MAHTVEYQTIDLRGRVANGASIEFLVVEVPVGEFRAPFAIVRYALRGREQVFGLRLDLDKQVFLDHFEEDSDKEEVLRKAAPDICVAVYEEMFNERREPSTIPLNIKRVFYAEDSGSSRWPHVDSHVAHHREASRIFMCYDRNDYKWAGMFKEHLEHTLRLEQPSEFEWLDAAHIRSSNLLRRLPDAPSVILVFISQDLADSGIETLNRLSRTLHTAQRMGTKVVPIIVDSSAPRSMEWLSEFHPVNISSGALSPVNRYQKEEALNKVAEVVEESLKD